MALLSRPDIPAEHEIALALALLNCTTRSFANRESIDAEVRRSAGSHYLKIIAHS